MMNIIDRNQFNKLSLVEGCFILMDKPFDWTSFDVVNKLRYTIGRCLGTKRYKLGHAGTLDPYATGLLVLGAGKYTKQIEQIQGAEKVYEGSLAIGATTPSYDRETEVDQIFDTAHLTEDHIRDIAKSFVGTQQQMPPIFSAVKVDGVRAYKAARRGDAVHLKSRTITIYQFDILRIDLQNHHIDFQVRCSKGTYIRSLVHDLGKALHSGAYLTALRRTQIADFKIDDALTIDEFVNSCKALR